ncbi:transposase [Kocuria rosea]|uniref:transposase n=1 Tax=Kocuria rosea TaxID=1275 RepID=UPI00339B5789
MRPGTCTTKSILPGIATKSSNPSTTPALSRDAGSSSRTSNPSQFAPSAEIAQLGLTLGRWRSAVLAYFDTAGASIRFPVAINGLFETMRRVARAFRNFKNYRLRVLFATGVHQPRRSRPALAWIRRSRKVLSQEGFYGHVPS